MPITEEFVKHLMEQNAAIAEQISQLTKTVESLNQTIQNPLHGGQMLGTFPEHVKASVQYGLNLQALVVALNTVGAVSINRTHEILGSVFSIPLSTGTIKNMVKQSEVDYQVTPILFSVKGCPE